MNIQNLTIDEKMYSSKFMLEVGKQIYDLLTEIKQEYRGTAEQLSFEIVSAYKELKTLAPGKCQDNILANLKHLQAGMKHFEATIAIKLYDKVMKICEISMNIAIKIAIASIIAL